MGKIIIAGIVVLVLLSGAYLYRPVYIEPAPVEAQGEFSFTVTAYSVGSFDGQSGECFPDGVANFDVQQPWRQVIITDAQGSIVEYVDIRAGEFTEIDGNMVCAIRQTITVKESPFYTVTIDDDYKRTVSPQAIEEFGGELFIQVG